MERRCHGRALDFDGLWSLHYLSREIDNDTLEALEALVLTIKGRLDIILRSGTMTHAGIIDHSRVATMLADLGEQWEWRMKDPTRAPVPSPIPPAPSRLPLDAIDGWWNGTAFDALGMGV